MFFATLNIMKGMNNHTLLICDSGTRGDEERLWEIERANNKQRGVERDRERIGRGNPDNGR